MGTMKDFLRQRKERAASDATAPATTAGPAATVPAPPAETKPPARPKKPKALPTEADPKLVVTRSCGCKVGLAYLQKSDCPGCMNRKRRERQRQQNAERQATDGRHLTAKQARKDADSQRLPDGAAFKVEYDAAAKAWAGTLTLADGRIFSDSASGVFKLLVRLDAQYRASLEPAQAIETGPAKAQQAGAS